MRCHHRRHLDRPGQPAQPAGDIQAEPSRQTRDLFAYLADNLPRQVQAIYVIGQGAPLMAGKVVAARNRVPLVVIPTALDSDAAISPVARLDEPDEDGVRAVWEETGPATDVIIDWEIIQAAPPDERGAGIVDVSVVTGLFDWRYAAQKGRNLTGQRFSPWAAGVALAGVAGDQERGGHRPGNRDALRTLLDLMMTAVQVSNQLGHTRPARAASITWPRSWRIAPEIRTAPWSGHVCCWSRRCTASRLRPCARHSRRRGFAWTQCARPTSAWFWTICRTIWTLTISRTAF